MLENKTYKIYIDESSIDNPENQFMVVGGVFIDKNEIKNIKNKLNEIIKKYKYSKEIKWVNVDQRNIQLLKEFTEYLISLDHNKLSINYIVIDKTKIDYEKYHNGDKELAFFKFTYQLLENRLKNNSKYYIFLDYKPTKINSRLIDLKKILSIYAGFYKNNCTIKHLQAYNSKENILLQVADIFAGAIGYHYNFKKGQKHNKSKFELSKFIANKLGKDNLIFSSPLNEKKFNIFKIKLFKNGN